MNVALDDIRRIGGSLLLLVAVGAAGAGAVYATMRVVQAQRVTTRAAEQQATEARNRVSFVQQEKEELKTLYPIYLELMDRGVIGAGRRLDWVEAVESLKNRLGLFSLTYTLSKQDTLDVPAASQARDGFEVRANPMKLDFTLLHEGQLADFLSGLRTDVKGLGLVDRCSVERTGTGRELHYGPQLKAECVVDWVNLKEKGGS
jgi:hypothetical protein